MHDYKADAKVFKAFCDVNRLQILEQLRSGEKCSCVLLEKLQISQSTLSYHMKILCDSGVVVGRAEGAPGAGSGEADTTRTSAVAGVPS